LTYPTRSFLKVIPVLAVMLVLLSAAGPAFTYDRNFVESLEGYYARPVSCGNHIIYYGDRGEKLAIEIEKILCRAAGDIAAGVGLEKVSPVAFIIAPDTPAFRRLHGGRLPEWGEAFGDSRRMIIGIDASRVLLSNRPFETVVRHELSHVFLAQRTGRARCPSWFVEGIAMRQSREWTLGDQWRLALTVARDDVPRLEDLQGRFPKSSGKAAVAYRISYAAVEELIGGEERDIVTFTAFLRDTRDFEKAFTLTFGETTAEFSGRFEASMRSRYHRTALFLNISPYGLMLSALFLFVYFLKRNRSRKKVEEWESEDTGPPAPPASPASPTPPTVH
jgi:hypothetical protein